ncbi:MAG: hypothetical protein F4186_12585 [Boseongicola sp. SB0676_bin_33]|nr:hypothetical protein [Boseongicola sp. SB0676_bin_33]MYK30675.1 hypothetical protein [Boseongicola sp. SB0670_bin_30]
MTLRAVLVLILAAAGPVLAQGGLDRVLDGFDDAPAFQPPDDILTVLEGFDTDTGPASRLPPPAQEPNARLQFGGRLSQRIVFNVAHDAPPPSGEDHRGLSSMQSRLDLEADARLGSAWKARVEGHVWIDPAADRANGGAGRSSEFSDAYGREAEIDEFFLQGPISGNLDLTVGRQILAWGRSDLFRVTDVLNPVDNRLPGLTDIKDHRLPVTALRLDRYENSWSVSMIAIPERRFDKLPVPGSDFFVGTEAPPQRTTPDDAFGAPELALALNGTFPGWDISLYGARVIDDRPHLAPGPSGLPQLRHGRITMAGAAGNLVRGSWLVKAEAALFNGLRFSNAGARTFSRLTTLAGVEYSGLADSAIALEARNDHISDFDDRLASPPDDRRRNETATALRVQRTFLNDALDVTFLALTFGKTGELGAVRRLQFDYAWTDALQLSTGLVAYQSGGQAPFRGIGNNDRLFATLNYHF